MENGDKSGEDSVICPIWQWPIFQAGPHWKPFPYVDAVQQVNMSCVFTCLLLHVVSYITISCHGDMLVCKIKMLVINSSMPFT